MSKTKKTDGNKAAGPRIAVAGCGHWGRNLVRNFAALGSLAAVSDQDPAVAGLFAEKHGVPALSWQELLADDGIDGIVVAAPAVAHYRLAKEALSAGKHVFVEKPLALRGAEAVELCRLAEDAGRILMVGHLLQYHPAFRRLKELVRSGDLGRLQYVYSNRLNLGRVRREENILWSFAPHDISMILSLVGEDPTEVSATGASYLHRQIADVTTTNLSFAGGQQAHIFVSWLHPFKEQKLIVVGDRGMAVFDDGEPWSHKLTRYAHNIDWREGKPEPRRADAEPVALEEAEPLSLECQHFLDCIKSGETPLTDGEEGSRVLRVLEAAEESMKTRRVVSLLGAAAGVPGAHPGTTIHESAYVDEPAEIGPGTKIWHFSHVLKGSAIGRDCVIGQNVVIGPDVQIGNACRIQNNVSVYKGVTLEDGVFCGPSMVFTNVVNPRAEVSRKDEFKPTLVKRGATIGANATILCGLTLGEYCFVAAGAVVTKDVLPHALVTGVPARRTGWMSHDGEKLGADLICPRSGRRYAESAAGLHEIEEGALAHQN